MHLQKTNIRENQIFFPLFDFYLYLKKNYISAQIIRIITFDI